MLGIILMMTIKYTDKVKATRQKRHLSRRINKVSISTDDDSNALYQSSFTDHK